MEDKEIQKESESKKDSKNEELVLSFDTKFINSQISDPMENVVDYD